jgi:hypothetical protein
MWRRAAQTCSCQASAEQFQQCAEFPLLPNRGLGPLAVTVLPIPLARRAAATACAAVQSTASLFRRWRPAVRLWGAKSRIGEPARRDTRRLAPSLSRPTVKNQLSSALRLTRRTPVAFAGRNDRALHQHMPGLCKFFGLSQIRIIGQRADNCSNLGQMGRCRVVNRTVRFRFEQHVDE